MIGKRKGCKKKNWLSEAAPYRRNHLDAKTCCGFLHTNYSSALQETSMTEGVTREYGGRIARYTAGISALKLSINATPAVCAFSGDHSVA
jgi:hypothetical protein